ncbi:UNVERIFIED_CONTAM: hypothetical protein HDU68_006952 [Siphonaria sp. JEL0065]|nr:hypothetical protein HDU68_006952 [Siphonaria sp. JEL0065]
MHYDLTIGNIPNTNCWSGVNLNERVFALAVPATANSNNNPRVFPPSHNTNSARATGEATHPSDFIDITVGVLAATTSIPLPATFSFALSKVDVTSILKNTQGSAQIVATTSNVFVSTCAGVTPSSDIIATVTDNAPTTTDATSLRAPLCFSVKLCDARSNWAPAATPTTMKCYDTGLDAVNAAGGLNELQIVFQITGAFSALNAKREFEPLNASVSYTLSTPFDVSSTSSNQNSNLVGHTSSGIGWRALLDAGGIAAAAGILFG